MDPTRRFDVQDRRRCRIDEASSSSSPQHAESQHLVEPVGIYTTVKISSSLFKLYEPSRSDRISLDIFFFHGLQLQCDSELHLSTWRSADGSQEIWPQSWLSTKYPGARIISVSYDASISTTGTEGMMDLQMIGEMLMSEIRWVREKQGKDCPVILVGHSFGGLVIEELCLHAYRNKENVADGHEMARFLDSLEGIFFYATPHHGMNEMLAYTSLINSSAANEPLLRFVKSLSTDAARLRSEFHKRCRDYKWKIYSVGETRAVAGQRTLVVPEASSPSW